MKQMPQMVATPPSALAGISPERRMALAAPALSVVVAVYNEEGNILLLDAEIKEAVGKITPSFEVIYVNDGSTDGTLAELRKLSGVTVIDLNRNYGQATAFDAGFKAASGEIVASLDGDLQNDPKDIALLLAKMRAENLDVVAGWRRSRQDKGGIRVLTRIGMVLRRLLINDKVHDSGCTLRVYKREAVKSLDIGGEMHRYILALLRWKGFTIGEVVVNDRPRVFGKSKYNYTKAVRGFIDLIHIWFIHKYSQRPLHLFGYLSIGSGFLGVLAGGWTLYGKFFLNTSLNRNGWFFITFFLLMSCFFFFTAGVMTDLIIRTQMNTSPYERRYYVRSVSKL